MKVYRVKLRPLNSFISQLQADSLFGAICWVIRYTEGAEKLMAMLSYFDGGNPPFILSNGYPGDLLPRPLIPPRVRDEKTTKREQLAEARLGKKLKSTLMVTPQEFVALARGEKSIPGCKAKEFVVLDLLHAQVNRVTGTTGEGGELFSTTERFLNEKAYQYISVYFKCEDEWLEKLEGYFHLMAQTGIGKGRTVGKGAFEVLGVESFDLFANSQGNAFISLSNFVPAVDDPVDGYYKLLVKHGKLGESRSRHENPFKRPLVMFQAGSAFKTDATLKPYYGKMVKGIAPGTPEVMQYGYAFAVPAWIGEV